MSKFGEEVYHHIEGVVFERQRAVHCKALQKMLPGAKSILFNAPENSSEISNSSEEEMERRGQYDEDVDSKLWEVHRDVLNGRCKFLSMRDPEAAKDFVSPSGGMYGLPYSKWTEPQKRFWGLIRQCWREETRAFRIAR
jgi:hypothetical protein